MITDKLVFDDSINMTNVDDYTAVIYDIKYKDKYKKESETKILDTEMRYVRIAYDFDRTKLMGSFKLTTTERMMPMPYISGPSDEERDVIFIVGSSGCGKSYFTNFQAKLYKFLTGNKIFYLTTNNVEKDRSLDKNLYVFLDVYDFLDYFSDPDKLKEFTANSPEFDNSLIIFDDIDAIEGKNNQKVLYSVLNVFLTNKRKNNISIIFISHQGSDYRKTSLIIKEMNKYVVYPSSQTAKADIVLNDKLKLTTAQIKRIVDEDYKNSKFVSIDIKRRLITTANTSYFL